MAQGEVRSYAVNARSTDTHGRVMCNVRNHHFVIDGPVQNGCPGEEVTPAELFLTGIAACGVELLQSFAKAEQVPLRGVRVDVSARSSGIGRRLFAWAIERAREKGCHMVQLTSDKTRPDAIRFYESLGFVASHEGMKLHFPAPANADRR